MRKMCASSLGLHLHFLGGLPNSEMWSRGTFYTCVHLCHLLPHTRSQEALLTSMEVGPNIAHNAALRENVFMMAICIDLKIPLFIIGKPGSSKSLAKSIVTSSMKGAGSSKSFLKCFKEVGTFAGAINIHELQKHDSYINAGIHLSTVVYRK